MNNLSLVLRNNPHLLKSVAKKHRVRKGGGSKKGRKGKKGGFLPAVLGAVAGPLIKAGVDGIVGLINKKRGKGIKSIIQKYAPRIKDFVKAKAVEYAPRVKTFLKDKAIDFAVNKLQQQKGSGMRIHGNGMRIHGNGMRIHGNGMSIHGNGMRRGRGLPNAARAPTRAFKVTIVKPNALAPKKILS